MPKHTVAAYGDVLIRTCCVGLWNVNVKSILWQFVETHVHYVQGILWQFCGNVCYVQTYWHYVSWRTCTLCQSILWQLEDMYIMSKHALTVGGHAHYVKAYFDKLEDMYIMSKHTLTVGGHAHYVKAYFDSWRTCTLCQSILWQLGDMHIMSKHTLTVGGHVHYVKAYFDSWRTCTLCQSILWQLGHVYIMSKHTLTVDVHVHILWQLGDVHIMSKHTSTVGGHVHYVKEYFDNLWKCAWEHVWQFMKMCMPKHTVAICGTVHAIAYCGDLWNCTCHSILWWSVELYMP